MADGRGEVVLVGAGPGDPDLLTVGGANALSLADAIVYDALASPAVLRIARRDAEMVFAGKRAGAHAMTQDQINATLVELASAGKRVVRLKGGDPFVFGRGSEEGLACRAAGIPFRVVPGVSSAIAAPAYAGIPVTHRQVAENFLVLTAHEAGEEETVDWVFASYADTLVILMGASSLAQNMARLIAAGKPPETPAASIRWGTRPDQQVVVATVATLAEEVRRAGLTAPLATVVGPVAAMADELAWFAPGPLAGHRVAVTRARSEASDLAARLEALGAFVVEAPAIAIRFPADTSRIAEAIATQPDWVVFTSANAVRAVRQALDDAWTDVRALAGVGLAAIGTATAEALTDWGLRVDFVPSRATSEVLAREIPLAGGERILLPLSSLSDASLQTALTDRGAVVERVTAYENVIEPLDEQQRREVLDADIITFTSASTATNLRESLAETPLPTRARLVSIGPQTSAAVEHAFGRVDREARDPSIVSLVEAVLEVAG